EKVEAVGLIFIGPPASAIRAMGLKDAAKALMEQAGVPVVPGYHGDNQDSAFLAERAAETGYPVLIKARAGGGGKGMRRVDEPAAFSDALVGARREGEASFGDPAVLLEKYVATPRHIEIQIFGDSHGNVVHLFERDCSLQRRHQKVIEEAPAPGMSDAMREAMGSAAVKAAKAIGYQGAGTIEFIVDASGDLREESFYFMEMNTRLQVEHPVTEAITGLDLVEWQLRVAAGERLPLLQDELVITGHAVEARVYAEDAAKGFLPATGRLNHLVFPEDARVDAGVRCGDAISSFYDPMIAKIICHGPTREIALSRLGRAISGTEAAGCVTNLGFLARLIRSEEFVRGRMDTGLIAREEEALLTQPPERGSVTAAAAVASLGVHQPAEGPFAGLGAWRLWGDARMSVSLSSGGTLKTCHVTINQPLAAHVEVDGSIVLVGWDAGRFHCRSAGREERFRLAVIGGRITVFDGADSFVFEITDPLDGTEDESAVGDVITAPMSGLVKAVHARTGQVVRLGDPLLILEAMKMEHTLTAPRDGEIAEILAAPGDQVEESAQLLTLVPKADIAD
ncbi:MAG: biotin/lipoyl-containing protein, partial [Pseudomonadota bacterium]